MYRRSIPVMIADGVSAKWEQRFVRDSAARGEEAVTADLVHALEEDLAPYVLGVDSFTRREEGGSETNPGTGADLEIHFVTPDNTKHLSYRVQAKLAKRTRKQRRPLYDYDFKYEIRPGEQQIDALLNAPGKSIPLYFLYNEPDAVDEILSMPLLRWPDSYSWHPWILRCAGYGEHTVALRTALTISSLPAVIASFAAQNDPNKLTNLGQVARCQQPWSCLFHDNGRYPQPPLLRNHLSMSQLVDGARAQLEFSVAALETILATPESEAYTAQLRDQVAALSEQTSVPEEIVQLRERRGDFQLDDLAQARRTNRDQETANEVGDVDLGRLLVIEVVE